MSGYCPEEKGELRILGRPDTLPETGTEALCRHLESCVGKKVAEVIMNNHAVRLGKEEAEYVHAHNPQPQVQQILDILLQSDRISRLRIDKNHAPGKQLRSGERGSRESGNNRNRGKTAKTLTFSYWAGALSLLLGREHEVGDATYDQGSSQLKGRLIAK